MASRRLTQEQIGAQLKAISDPTRWAILQQVRSAGVLTCSDLHACCRQAQPTISHHVKTLAEAGLLRTRARGQFHELRVNEGALRALAAVLAGPPKRGVRRAARTSPAMEAGAGR